MYANSMYYAVVSATEFSTIYKNSAFQNKQQQMITVQSINQLQMDTIYTIICYK